MCTAKPPKQTAPVDKPVQYMRNPYLDGYSMGRSATVGRNSLRVDSPRQSTPYVAPTPPPGYVPNTGSTMSPLYNGSAGYTAPTGSGISGMVGAAYRMNKPNP